MAKSQPAPRTRKPAPPTTGAWVLLYHCAHEELLGWVGHGSEEFFRDALESLRSDEDSEWEPQELQLLERLLRRAVFEGLLFDGLNAEERYYLSQLLIDLFDEWVDHDVASDELSLDQLLPLESQLDATDPARILLGYVLRGREVGADQIVWRGGKIEDCLPAMGHLTVAECGALLRSLQRVTRRPGYRVGRAEKALLGAVEGAVEAELDLVSFVAQLGE